jgi:hypothetical protein
MLSWDEPKDPDDVADYQFDWTPRLETGEAIITSTFSKSGSIVLGSSGFDGPLTTVWISGGTDGEVCFVTNRIVTDNTPPRIYDQTARLRIKSQ